MIKGKIGIFFIINKKVIAHTEDIPSTTPFNGFHDAETGHDKWFDEVLSAKYPRFTDYTKIPRGRVVYKIKKKRFIIYLDKKADSEKNRKEIMMAFELKGKKTLFCYDIHYTTAPAELEKIFKE